MEVMKDDLSSFSMKTGDSVYVNQLLERYENRVTIDGAVFRPGEYAIKDKQTLLELIQSAEGLKDDALTGRVSIVRVNPDLSQENLSVNLAEIINKRASDIQLQREDLIVIPSIFDLTEKAVVRIQGAVNNPDFQDGVEFPFVRNMTIEDLVIKAGGLKESAALSKIEVVRRKRNVDPKSESSEISDVFEFTLNPQFTVARNESKFTLMPFDEVFVRNSPNYAEQSYVEIEGEIVYPGKYGIKRKDEKISDLVTRSGGLSPQAYIEGATLVRKVNLSDFELEQRRKNIREIDNGLSSEKQGQKLEIQEINETTMDAIGINLKKILENPGSTEDMILQEGDILRIPKRLETIRIQGEVLRPITVKFREGAKFEDYIAMAGGFTEMSLRKSSFVMYANGAVDRTRRVGGINLYPRIEPGSEIVVPTKTQKITPEQKIQRVQVIVTAVTATISTILTLITILRLNDIGNTNNGGQ
jgi:protein involved in polysaccharide export with SLBB domain